MQNTDLFFDFTVQYFEGWSNQFTYNIINDDSFKNNMLVEDRAFVPYSYDKSSEFLINLFIQKCVYGSKVVNINKLIDTEIESQKLKFKNQLDELSLNYKNLMRNNFTKGCYHVIELWLRLTLISNIIIDMDNLLQNKRLLSFKEAELNMQIYEMISYYSSQIVAKSDVKNLIKKAYEGVNTDVFDSGIGGAIAGGILFGPVGVLAGAALNSYMANRKKIFKIIE